MLYFRQLEFQKKGGENNEKGHVKTWKINTKSQQDNHKNINNSELQKSENRGREEGRQVTPKNHFRRVTEEVR